MPELSLKRRIALLITYFGIYLGLYQSCLMPLLYAELSPAAFRFTDTLIQIIIILVFLLISGKWLGEQWKQFRKKPSHNIGYTAAAFILMELYATTVMYLLVTNLHLATAENQANNLAYQNVNPIGFAVDALFCAPLMEELVFRGCIFAPLRKKHHFLTAAFWAGFLFGFMHIVSSLISRSWMNIWYILIYGGCGILLCFPYEAADSIFGSIFCHMLYNLIGVLAVIAG